MRDVLVLYCVKKLFISEFIAVTRVTSLVTVLEA